VPIRPDQVILPSTAMAELVAEYGTKRILAVARKDEFAHQLMAGYGFTDVVTVAEYAARHPVLFPYRSYPPDAAVPWEKERPVDAIFLLQVPGAACAAAAGPGSKHAPLLSARGRRVLVGALVAEEWGLALQICLDILRSTGVPGLANEAPKQVIPVFAGNPDFDYSALHSLPRYRPAAEGQPQSWCDDELTTWMEGRAHRLAPRPG